MSFSRKIRVLFYCLLPIAYCLLPSCSQKKNTFTARTFHNLGAHYNGLYWANVNLDEAVANIAKAHKDDYSRILPVFKYADKKAAEANFPQLDKAIEKTNRMIQYHSMLIKGVEHVRWIDENYMTMAKAHFYKRDYYAAVVVFEYVVKMYPNNPVRYDAFLWLVRCYNQMNSVIKTGPILDLLKHDKDMPKRLQRDYYAVLSDYNVRTEKYDKAKESLQKAAILADKKTTRGRYLFILAQLYEESGELKKATQYYSQSARLHPSYEMEFNARLAKARTFQVNGGADTKELKKELTKMLKDEKNREYLDQIYYALGDISYRENDVPSALGSFKLSAQNSVANTRQKGVSYLRIADIYFDRKDYTNAEAYYDSTMAFLPKDYKNYDYISNKKESLSSLIKNISIISQEDSLLKVAAMDTARIGKIIDEVIAKLIADEEKKKKEQEAAIKNPTTGNGTGNDNNPWETAATGTWYFYNSATVSHGFAEFFKKWGSRPLEDNWRRLSKETVMAELPSDTAHGTDTAGTGKIDDNKTRAYYMKNLPFTEVQKERSHKRITDAYYALGGIYKEDLQDNQKAAETFEEMLKRYPDSKYALNLYYQLYRLYTALGNQARSDIYKNKILNEHPDSEYAKIIRNPDYQKALMASKGEIEKYYGETYQAYRTARYGEVIAMVNKADSFYSSSELMPKFAMLRAFSIGRTRPEEEYVRALQGIVAKYPKDPVKDKAQELLDHLKKMKEAPVDSSALNDTAVFRSPYTYRDSAEHQCIIVLPAKANINDFKARVSNFNAEYFRLSDLNISNVLLDMEHQVVIVKKFAMYANAKDYFDLVNQDSKVFKDMKPDDYQVFPITPENFIILYREKDVPGYQRFYLEKYKKKTDN